MTFSLFIVVALLIGQLWSIASMFVPTKVEKAQCRKMQIIWNLVAVALFIVVFLAKPPAYD